MSPRGPTRGSSGILRLNHRRGPLLAFCQSWQDKWNLARLVVPRYETVNSPCFPQSCQDAKMPSSTESGDIDSRNRHRACELAGVVPQYAPPFDGTDEEALAFVLSKNLNRRHLDSSQRAMVATLLANMPDGKPNSNRANLPGYNTTKAEAAEKLSVSERSVKTGKRVIEHGRERLQICRRCS